MRNTLLFLLLFSLSASASTRYPREAEFLIEAEGRVALAHLYFSVELESAAYYWAPLEFPNEASYASAEPNALARLVATPAGVEVTLERPATRSLWRAQVTAFGRVGHAVEGATYVMPGTGSDDARLERRSAVTGSNQLFWYDWSAAIAQPGRVSVTPLSALVLPEGRGMAAHETTRISGPADFRACDGCEHADQLLVTDGALTVNLATLDFGRYGYFDCEGKRHPWLDQLVELGVPFNWKGELSVLTGDYWDPGDFWTAIPGPAVGLGRDQPRELIPFLDSLDPFGEFVSYRAGRLTFRGPGGEQVFEL